MASYLDRLRTNPFYTGLKTEVVKVLNKVPLFGDPAERFLAQLKEAVKAGLHGGMLFEDLGFRYLGPVDGHDIAVLRKYLHLVKTLDDPILLHVVTEKGHGYQPAARDPVYFHSPPALGCPNGEEPVKKKSGAKAYTNLASEAIRDQMLKNPRVTVLTAAMCQGNKLEVIRDEFPARFFDVGICESHAVAFAAGLAKAGLRPIVDIYSTFLQRAYDQVFQEVALQNLPVTFMMDRAGATGPDGPTHHGMFDIGYLRVFPNLVVMAPGDSSDLTAMVELALGHPGPSAIRYPKANADTVPGPRAPVELGRAEVLRWGRQGMILAYGTLLSNCLAAADQLRDEGLDVGVVNARFVKPIDRELLERLASENLPILTVEEGALMGGFGSALLEAANEGGLNLGPVKRLGIPDRFIEHADRDELLAELGLDTAGIARACRSLTGAQASPV
jgi:1-deoxy-D-xylulose-5-phosphate synthase